MDKTADFDAADVVGEADQKTERERKRKILLIF